MLSNCLNFAQKTLNLLSSATIRNFHLSAINNDTLLHMHNRAGRPKCRPDTKNPLGGNPHLRGVVLKLMILRPKKPSSGNRKCVLVRLTNGREIKAYVPGEAHNLQEHSVVLVEGGRKKDLMGVLCRVVRGKYDCNKKKKVEPTV